MYLIDIFRTFYANAEEYTFFSSVHGTFSRIDHILGHKSNLSKFKKMEIISSIFSDHNAMRLGINYKKKHWGWCTGTTQRDEMGREEGGGFRMGNTCIPVVVDSF